MPAVQRHAVAAGPGLGTAQWRIIALIQMRRGRGLRVTSVGIERDLGLHPDSSRYARMLEGLREAGYLRNRGLALSPSGRATAAWPRNVVTCAAPFGMVPSKAPREVLNGSRLQSPRFTPDQRRTLKGLREVLEDLKPFQGRQADPSTGRLVGLDPREVRFFSDRLHLLARRIKAAVRWGLTEHPLVAPWVQTISDVERLAEFEAEVIKVQRAFAGLEHLLQQAETWVGVAKVSAARTAEAAGPIIVTQSVVDVAVTLKQMSDRIQVLRSSQSPAMGEVLQAIQRAERLTSTHIRIPEVCWPENGDMFAPPKLREWGAD
jgi:hypothetical protein